MPNITDVLWRDAPPVSHNHKDICGARFQYNRVV